jgi:hypothetical protein
VDSIRCSRSPTVLVLFLYRVMVQCEGGNGVGEWQVSDIVSNSVEMTARNGPIVRFSGVKRLFFPRVDGESEAAFYSRLHQAYPG